MPYVIVILLLVGLDQLVKALVRANIPLYESVPFIPHVLELTHVKNTGAAFSVLAEHTWLLTLVSLLAAIGLGVVLVLRLVRHPLGRWSVAVVLAGAVGNLIDRALFGKVTDMFNVLFMRFAVFNVADICVVLGGIALLIYALKFWEADEKLRRAEKGTDHDQTGAAG